MRSWLILVELVKKVLTAILQYMQGKEYVFIANSDNLGATVDLSILMTNYLTSAFRL